VERVGESSLSPPPRLSRRCVALFSPRSIVDFRPGIPLAISASGLYCWPVLNAAPRAAGHPSAGRFCGPSRPSVHWQDWRVCPRLVPSRSPTRCPTLCCLPYVVVRGPGVGGNRLFTGTGFAGTPTAARGLARAAGSRSLSAHFHELERNTDEHHLPAHSTRIK